LYCDIGTEGSDIQKKLKRLFQKAKRFNDSPVSHQSLTIVERGGSQIKEKWEKVWEAFFLRSQI